MSRCPDPCPDIDPEERVSLYRAEQITGKARRVLSRWVDDGELDAIESRRGAQATLKVRLGDVLARIAQEAVQVAAVDYDALIKQWEDEQRSGYHNNREMEDGSIETNKYGLSVFWRCMGTEPSVAPITAENFRLAKVAIGVDHEAKNCHFSVKDNMYKALRSFVKFLIRQGLKTQADLNEFTRFKPKRLYDPVKTVLTEDQLLELLRINKVYLEGGRTDYDVALTQIIIAMMAYGGLRSEETCNILVSCIDFKRGRLTVIDGKGHKNRVVGIMPELEFLIQEWLKVRPKGKGLPANLILQASGKPITPSVLRRVQRLCEHTIREPKKHSKEKKQIKEAKKLRITIKGKEEIDVTPHGLRCTFATMLHRRRIPIGMIQKALGHADIETTMGYIMPDEEEMVDLMRGQHAPLPTMDSKKLAALTKIERMEILGLI